MTQSARRDAVQLELVTYRARSPAKSTHGMPAARTNGRRNPGPFTV